MGKFGKLFTGRYDDTVKTRGGRKDFPTGTFVAVCDKIMAHKTDDDEPRTYLKAYFTILAVERGGDDTAVGNQHTIAFFKSGKFKFFERDTKSLAGAVRGLDVEETDALKKETVNEILENEAHGRVLRIRAVQKSQESKKEEGKKKTFTNVEYLGRLDKAEITTLFEDDPKGLKKFFPQGLSKDGRGVGFGDDSEEPTVENENDSEDGDDEEPAPKPKAKAKAKPKADEESDDEDEESDD